MLGKWVRLTAIVGAVVLSASACGGSSTADSGNKQKDLVIGFPAPITSGNASYADQMIKGAQLAVDEVNAAGGAGGRKLVLKTYDDKLSPDESAKVAQRAVTVDKAEVIVGGYTSIEGLAIREVTERRKVIYINPSTISPQLTDGAKYTFRVAVDQREYPAALLKVAQVIGSKRPALLADSGATGSTISKPTQQAFEQAGLPLAGAPVTYELNAPNLSAPVGSIVAQKPDAIIAAGSSAADYGLIIKTLVEQGLKVPVIGLSNLVSPDTLKVAGDSAVKALPGLYTLVNKLPSKPEFQTFVSKYQKAYGGETGDLAEKLSEQSANSYDTIKILAEALDATKGETGGDDLAGALHALQPYAATGGGAGAKISFASSQSGFSNSLVPSGLVDGKLVPVK